MGKKDYITDEGIVYKHNFYDIIVIVACLAICIGLIYLGIMAYMVV